MAISVGTLLGFLLVLARVGGALVFVPLPGMNSAAAPARVALALGFTIALMARWPQVEGVPAIGTLVVWVAGESALGIATGAAVALVLEAFVLAAQILGLQAGYAYAQTIDPNTEADSGVLLVLAQLVAGMLFFALGLDREVLRLFADSLERIPAGSFVASVPVAQALVQLGANLFPFALRLAFPVVGMLILVDVSLALLGRLNSQLQLLTLAFPAKMLTALVVLSAVAALFPRLMLEFAGLAWSTVRHIR